MLAILLLFGAASPAVLSAQAVGGQAAGGQSAEPPARTVEGELATKVRGSFTVAAVGDLIAPQPINRAAPEFARTADVIRHADVGFANMESSLVDFRKHEGGVGGTLAPLEMGDSLKSLGITLVSRANNHALDGGVEGMVSTDLALDRLGIAHAGSGRDLQEARGARFLETPKGRVGLVSMFAVEDVGNFGPAYVRTAATLRNGDIGGAPGVNPLYLTTYHVVSPADLEAMKAIAARTYGQRAPAHVAPTETAGARFRYFDEWYEAGDRPGTLRYAMNPADERGNLEAIRSGKVQSDFLIATIHSHQSPAFCGACAFGTVPGMKEELSHEPPDYLVKLAREAIDNGADMFVSHGVHALAGIEIYKGRPIFYGLSNFIFQFGLQFGDGYDAMANYRKRAELENPASLESVLASVRYENGKLAEVRLYPVDLGGRDRPISQLGIPQAASPAVAQRILSSLQQWSQPFGTRIVIENGVGVIRVP
ncbi:CapA family protein [Novosphingobium flavum]|uniref:CapA family protein n=1 Tax=Novosphingobium flavum TaxID=1778672 RepID=A0A7X1FRY4_9SPHN|nr:CapA family protein [Novosphingobium flavum]MBC2665869.1 CapA family protein [Novosphingobium flavum]